jgi:2-oxoglutarate ferredoxin oxidoreductase subunit beta
MSEFSKFCPGCGQTIILQTLYRTLQENKCEDRAVLGLDIGCALLAWDFLPINTFQTHHGRVTPTMVGFKRASPKSLCFAYTGDGGAYAIGLQSLLWSAMRNEAVSVLVVNNAVYAMTGGQTSPTTPIGQITSTSPTGNVSLPVLGPELIRNVNKNAYLARAACNDIKTLKLYLHRAFEAQRAGNFSLVEVLSFCPTNWRTRGVETNGYLENLKKIFRLGEV